MRWTFPLIRLFGIPIRMHWLLAILILARILQGWSRWGTWGLEWMSITMAILLVSILFHELSHCWMGIRLGGHAESILLWPLGGLASIEHSGRPAEQIKISGIGPISSFVLGGICAAILVTSGAHWQWDFLNPWAEWWPFGLNRPQGFLLHAVKLNLMLGLFNLCVPAYPLDGGQMLYSFLSLRYERYKAAQVATSISLPIAVAMVVWGIAQEELNLILVGAWILIEAFRMRQLIRVGGLDSHPAFGSAAGQFDYMPDRPKKKGWFARWRERRAMRSVVRRTEREQQLSAEVDSVLEKVSREGIGSLSEEERRILDEASRRGKKE